MICLINLSMFFAKSNSDFDKEEERKVVHPSGKIVALECRGVEIYDYVIIGSGFGGSVSAMRLTEKGYSVLVLEKGKRYEDKDFAKTNWQYWKYLWLPAIRAYGILQVSILKGVMVLHGAGVGGGSLGYANVLEVPSDETFATPAWNQNVKWGKSFSAAL